MKIKIITTGGTIDKVYFDAKSTYQVGETRVRDILQEAHITVEYEIKTVLSKDSLDLTDQDRKTIYHAVANDSSTHILVTHGTDTMIDTARLLRSLSGKVIVLTGSMQPALFRNTDAVFNVGFALAAVQTLSPGTYIAMNGRLFDPEACRKNREENRFEEK